MKISAIANKQLKYLKNRPIRFPVATVDLALTSQVDLKPHLGLALLMTLAFLLPLPLSLPFPVPLPLPLSPFGEFP